MISYKIDVVAALKAAGYSTYCIRTHKIMGEATVQKLRKGELVSWENINTLCELLSCQPGELLRYVNDFAPPGEWCDGCKKLGGRSRGGGDGKIRPWCFMYAAELANEGAKARKCEKCLLETTEE